MYDEEDVIRRTGGVARRACQIVRLHSHLLRRGHEVLQEEHAGYAKTRSRASARLIDAERTLKYGILNSQSLPSAFIKITEAQQTVDACFVRIGVQGAPFTLVKSHYLPSQCNLSRTALFKKSSLSLRCPLRVGMTTSRGLAATSIVRLYHLRSFGSNNYRHEAKHDSAMDFSRTVHRPPQASEGGCPRGNRAMAAARPQVCGLAE